MAAYFIGASLLVDDCAHMLTIKCGKDVLRVVQCIYDLKLFETFGPLKESEDRTFYDQVVQIQAHEFLGRNSSEKLHVLFVPFADLLRVAIKKTSFVF